jgi:DNA replication and repair protein RecF
MNVQKLKLSSFRNYKAADFSFEPATVHILYGNNAQGKTNILEAIYFLSHLRSWRTSKTASLVMHEQPSFVLECTLESNGRKEEIKAVLAEGKKYLYRFGKPVSTFSSFVGTVNAVLFCPDDLAIFSAPPKNRRQFIDMELVKLSKSYTATLSRYQKLLKDRSAALKSWPVNDLLLDTITQQMIDAQCVLIRQRNSFVLSLQEQAQKILPQFTDGKESLQIKYKTCVDPQKDIKAQLEEAYAQTREKDKKMKTTSIGVHKDDLEFYLQNRLVTQTASQGQRRSVVLAVKLGLCEMIHEKTGQYPVLLLDDVFSELDEGRKARLTAALPEDMQIFITTADPVSPALFSQPAKFYTVDHGVMKEGIYDV